MTGITIRLDADAAVATRDGGETLALAVDAAGLLTGALTNNDVVSAPALTAGALASVAEARLARPISADASEVSWRKEPGSVEVELGPRARGESLPLAAILAMRRSGRAWSGASVDLVARVLVGAARVQATAVANDGYVTSQRPTPSAGGRHPFELHVIANAVDGLERGSWHFDPLRCGLSRVATDWSRALDAITDALGGSTPPAAVVLVAYPSRTLSRYPTGMPLLWRDAGALLTTLHLCATDAGAASCIVGSCGVYADVLGASEPTIDVGALAFGAPSAQS